jgi:hypothetical protein
MRAQGGGRDAPGAPWRSERSSKTLVGSSQRANARTTPPVTKSVPLDAGHDPINDALDQLLIETQASLHSLEALRNRITAGEPHTVQKRGKKTDASNFWNPRCAGVWNLDEDSTSDLDSDCEFDDPDEISSVDSEFDSLDPASLWNLLRGGAPSQVPKSGQGTSASQNDSAAKRSVPGSFANVRNAPIPTAPSPAATATSSKQAPSRGPPPAQGKNAACGSCPTRVNGARRPPAPPPQTQHPSKPSERARAGGFQFGSFGSHSGGSANNAGSGGTEAEVKAVLEDAMAEGPNAVRKALKKLLLRWHPDKFPQGDTCEETSAREEATRILRFILNERERLGV